MLTHPPFDVDILVDYDDCACLSWKEILNLIDDYYKVNSFLIEYDVCVYENFILPKSMHLCMIGFVDNTSIIGE